MREAYSGKAIVVDYSYEKDVDVFRGTFKGKRVLVGRTYRV